MNIEFKKKMADSWFDYLQNQICREFEKIESGKNKFVKRNWCKDNKKEGGGTSFLLLEGSHENFSIKASLAFIFLS